MFTAAWEPLKSFATDSSKHLELKSPETWISFLTSLSSQFEGDLDLKQLAHNLAQLTARTAIRSCDADLKSEAKKVLPVHERILIRLLEQFPETLKEDAELMEVMIFPFFILPTYDLTSFFIATGRVDSRTIT